MQFSPGNASSRDFQLGQVYKNPAWNDTKQHLLASPIIKIQSALVGAIFFLCAILFLLPLLLIALKISHILHTYTGHV